MRRIWATATTVWAVLAVTAVLAWTGVRHSAAPAPAQATPTVLVVKGGKGAGAPVAVSLPAASAAPHATTHTS
jgi:hypothetical protein